MKRLHGNAIGGQRRRAVSSAAVHPTGNAYHTIGSYAGRILKGEKAADLPVQQVTKIERSSTSRRKALGLDFPATILAHADEVIE